MHKRLIALLLALASGGINAAEGAVSVLASLEARTGSGPEITGTQGLGLRATLEGGVQTADDAARGRVFSFPGGEGRVVLEKNIYMDNLRTQLTASLWIRPQSLPAGDVAMLITKRPVWSAGKPFSLELGRNGALSVNYHDGSWKRAGSAGGLVKPGEWQHVAMTYSMGGELILYHNSKVVARQGTPLPLTANGESFAFGFEKGGNFPGGNYVAYTGLMAGMRIFPVALTLEQVAQDMAGTLPLREPAPEELPVRGMQQEEIPAAVRDIPADAPLDAYIEFAREPRARGLWFERLCIRPETIKTPSGEHDAWVAQQGSASGVGHARSVLLRFADERFRNGKMPVVDIEITCMHPAWSGIAVWADTASGSRQIGSVWGNDKDFKTLSIRIEDAHFGGRDFGNPLGKLASDGYDLRINAATADFYIKSVRVRGYDREKKVDFARLLKLEDISSPEEIFFFANQGEHRIDYTWHNHALLPFQGEYSYRIVSHGGEEVAQGKGTLEAASDTSAVLGIPIDTGGLPNDIYYIELALRSDGAEIAQRSTAFGVHNPGIPPKAQEGDEFLFGMDVMLGEPWRDRSLLRWLDVLGVDIVRGGGDIDNFDTSMPLYRERNLQVMAVPDIPYNEDRQKMDAQIAEVARRMAEVAKKHPDIKYWELGNEPDLPGFYKGPIEEYLRAYIEVYRAIKAANPATVIMNGGLSFHGHQGMPRSRRFIELVPLEYIDALAYHGHGPLDEAERSALNRIRDTARDFGKDKKPYIETESGVAANKPAQEIMQARTVIAKMVYAWSEAVTPFFWFRLRFEHARSYGNLQHGSHREPRPAVLAYKTLVENLRGFSFQRMIQLENQDCQLYLFRGKDKGQMALVYWQNKPTPQNALLRLAAGDDDARNPHRVDMYGNCTAQGMVPGGLCQITITQDPAFLLWEAAEPEFVVAAADAIIAVPAQIGLLPGREKELAVRLRNPFGREINGELKITAHGDIPLRITPQSVPVRIAAGEETEIKAVFTADAATTALEWPQIWTAFIGVDGRETGMMQTGEIPRELPGTKGKVRARQMRLNRHTLDFAAAGGEIKERNIAIAYAWVESAEAQQVTIGSSADWWMEWYVNGEKVYDTMQAGNGSGYALTDHTFGINLKKGKNLLAVRVLSGSGGWKLVCGGPAELEAARSGGMNRSVSFSLLENGAPIVTQAAGIELSTPVMRVPGDFWRDGAKLTQGRPFAVLSEESLHNLHEKQPDKSMWWQGESDLSARLRLACDADYLYLQMEVTDDVRRHPERKDQMWKSDSLQIGLAPDKDGSMQEFCIGMVGGKVCIYKHGKEGALKEGEVTDSSLIRAEITEGKDGQAIYRVAMSRRLLTGNQTLFNVLVNDDDAGYRKQWIELRPGLGEDKSPADWLPLWLE